MKYFRYYSWGMQLVFLFVLCSAFFVLGSVCLIALLPKLSGFSLDQITQVNENSPYELVRIALVSNGVVSLLMFMVTALVFAYLTHPDPAGYLGVRSPKKLVHPLLAILIMVGAIPALEMIESLVSLLPFSAAIRAKQAANETMMNAFLNMRTAGSYFTAFGLMAVVPAIGEELFFRGVFMRLVAKKTKRATAIWFSAFIFAAAHSNIFGMVSIFIAGVLLALIYYMTGSIWCSILGHLCFNGMNVLLSYLSLNTTGVKSFLDNTRNELLLAFAGALLFAYSFYLLWKSRTPLPENWTDDFEALPQIPETENI